MTYIGKDNSKKNIISTLAILAAILIIVSWIGGFIVFIKPSIKENNTEETNDPVADFLATYNPEDNYDISPNDDAPCETEPFSAETTPFETESAPVSAVAEKETSFTFRTPSKIEIYSLIFTLLPIVVFLFLNYEQSGKYDVILPIIFAYYVIDSLVAFALSINVFKLSLAAVFAILTYGALCGLYKKCFSIYPLWFVLGLQVFSVISLFPITDPDAILSMNFVSNIALLIGTGLFILALLIFSENYRINIFIKPKSEKEQLELLNEQFKSGIITEEEYQTKRAEIISNL